MTNIPVSQEAASSLYYYPKGVINAHLPDSPKPPPSEFALQNPLEWLNCVVVATCETLIAIKIPTKNIARVGLDFTSSTILPVRRGRISLNTPHQFRENTQVCAKSWKHHTAQV